MLTLLEAYLKENWRSFVESPAVLNGLGWLIQSRSRILAFALPRNARWPVAVAKISRNEDTARRTANEFDNLQAILKCLSSPWAETVPYPVALEQIGQRTVAWERFVVGHPWTLSNVHFLEKSPVGPWSQVYRWLVNFQSQCTYGTQVLDDRALETNLVGPVASLLEEAGFSPRVQQQARDVGRRLRGLTVPRVHRHGDLHPTNLLFLGECLQGVTDWEMACPDVWPFYDWFQFLFEYHLELARKRTPSAERAVILQSLVAVLFDCASPHEETLRTWTIRFLANYGIPYEVTPLLWLHYAWEVYWPEDKEGFLKVVVPAVVQWAGWDA